MPEQNGIGAYAAYLPAYALASNSLEGAEPRPGAPVRSVAAYDEDAVTMAVEALREITAGASAGDRLVLATTSAPYDGKTSAGIVHAALGLDPAVVAADLHGNRSGATALDLMVRAGGVAAVSDVRMTRPHAPDELAQGDAAAAFTAGDAAAVLLARTGRTAEVLDRWRLPGERHDRVWDERFTAEVLVAAAREAAQRALADAGLDAADHVAVASPNARAAAVLRRALGGSGADAEVERQTGYTGAAHLGLLLAATLDTAEPGQTILLLSAAEGADAFVFRVGDGVRSARAGRPVREQLAGRERLGYGRYLHWRGLLDVQGPARPDAPSPAAPPMYRRAGWKYRLEGALCDACGGITTPPARACASCGGVGADEAGSVPMNRVSLRDRVATVVSVTRDRLTTMPDAEVAIVVADVEVEGTGGGRLNAYATDVVPEAVTVGMTMRPTFRRLWTTDAIHNYFWKLRPWEATTNDD
ncbi:3-hydroxy-3-methylglutaryl CoA synthase [Actinomadura hallensis]|uniref:3-hydroxy-3-methylglutaryl CoA synthase n=1 Tax=Actinomadura hallensis TaxID=337895 RepID=A0A543IGJ4_9ACTN|nr:hydroxymethylglutaryl-CoA synthase [Actinomadura hallensis]TQM69694.1 3-hydroxy-3-methylglutaryl CoA synthase [Actinomadura hallensis]